MKPIYPTIAAIALLQAGAAAASGQILFNKERPDPALNGAPFFGFVRDTAGKGLPQAQVTLASDAANTRVLLQTDRTGYFYFAGFRPEFDPQEVEIACVKSGYHLIKRIAKPSRAKPAEHTPIEVLCILERNAVE